MSSKRILFLVIASLLSCSAAFAQGVWTTNALVPAGFGREGACIAGSSAAFQGVEKFRIYIIDGFGPSGDSNTNYFYDPETDSYTTGLASIPGPPRSEGAGVERSGFIFCLGGRAGSALSLNQRYNPTTNSWVTLAALPVAVAAEYSAVVVGAEIHVIGGRTDGATVPFSGPKTSVHQVFHVGKQTWSFRAPLPGLPRSEMCAVAHGHKIYVTGGNVVPFDGAVSTLNIYDVDADSWSLGASMPAPRANAACAVLGNSIYVNGGKPGFAFSLSAATFRYDIDTDSWTPDTPKPTATGETVGISHGGQMFVIGGGFFGLGGGPLGRINESFRPTPP